MVQDVRRILLTPDELIAAFECHRRMTPDFLPEGQVVDCFPLEDNRVRITLHNSNASPAKTDFVMKSNDAVKPLIRFCLENNIVLPKEGQKSLYVKDGAASLYVVLNLTTDVSGFLPGDSIGRSHTFSPADIVKDATGTDN